MSQLKLARLTHKILTQTYSAVLLGDFHVQSGVAQEFDLGQFSTTLMVCSSAPLWKAAARCRFNLTLLFFQDVK